MSAPGCARRRWCIRARPGEQINQVIQAVNKIGLAVLHTSVACTEALGNLFQVSSRPPSAKEDDIIALAQGHRADHRARAERPADAPPEEAQDAARSHRARLQLVDGRRALNLLSFMAQDRPQLSRKNAASRWTSFHWKRSRRTCRRARSRSWRPTSATRCARRSFARSWPDFPGPTWGPANRRRRRLRTVGRVRRAVAAGSRIAVYVAANLFAEPGSRRWQEIRARVSLEAQYRACSRASVRRINSPLRNLEDCAPQRWCLRRLILLRAHSVLQTARGGLDAEVVADVGDAIRAGAIEVAMGALRFDDERGGLVNRGAGSGGWKTDEKRATRRSDSCS